MREEKKIVTRSLVILFLSLTIVYALAYMSKIEIFTADQEGQKEEEGNALLTGNQHTDPRIIDISGTNTGTRMSTIITGNAVLTGIITPSPLPLSGETLSNTTISPDSTDLASTGSITFLSGTTQFFGVLDIIDVLGIQPDYVLQDSRGNYFAAYGKKGLDFVRTVQQLGGNVYTMPTESEILANQLFGDHVSFINMAAFKDRVVLMVVEQEGETWLFQIPADKYHTSKSYLKSLFIH